MIHKTILSENDALSLCLRYSKYIKYLQFLKWQLRQTGFASESHGQLDFCDGSILNLLRSLLPSFRYTINGKRRAIHKY